MCGRNSKWLGPKRRKKEFGSENGGTPRPGGNIPDEPRGFARGARVSYPPVLNQISGQE